MAWPVCFVESDQIAQSGTQTWEAAAEFSDSNNPNGVWTYAFGRDGLEMKDDGTQTGLFIMKDVGGDGTLTWLAIGKTRGTRFGNSGIVGWKGTPYPGLDPECQLQKGNNEYWCVVAKNITDSNITISQYPSNKPWIAPAGKLIVNSCNDKDGSATRNIIQFKAPRAGEYTFRAVWTDLKVQKENYVNVSCLVYVKGRRLEKDGAYIGGSIYSGNNWEPCIATHTVILEPNDTIWFCNQNNNRYVPDNQLSLELTVSGLVPD